RPATFWVARGSTMATSTRASASSPASISPVGPPPAITTACSVIATLRSRGEAFPESDRAMDAGLGWAAALKGRFAVPRGDDEVWIPSFNLPEKDFDRPTAKHARP